MTDVELLPAAKIVSHVLLISITAMSAAFGQSPGPTQFGNFSGQYPAASWGQSNPPVWGAYSGTIGASGWRFNRALQPSEPEGAIVDPNQTLTFGNPQTGATLYRPQDTRLKARDRP